MSSHQLCHVWKPKDYSGEINYGLINFYIRMKCSLFLNQAKLIYKCWSHAKGDSQKFKIEEVEEL